MNPATGAADRTPAGSRVGAADQATGERQPLGTLIPAFFHPLLSPKDWVRLRATDVHGGYVVINAADGPGIVTDPHLRDEVEALRRRGVAMLGYLDTAGSTRPHDDLRREARRWQVGYGITGVFLHRVRGEEATLMADTRLVTALRGDGADVVALNPGRPVPGGYGQICDVLVTFEGGWQHYQDPMRRGRSTAEPAHTPGTATRCHLVHGVPRRHIGEVPVMAAERGAGLCYASPLSGTSPWRSLAPPPAGDLRARVAELHRRGGPGRLDSGRP